MNEEISSSKKIQWRLPRISGIFAAVVVTSMATAALTSLIFLSAFPAPMDSKRLSQSGTQTPSVSSHEDAVTAVVGQAASAVVSVVATKDLPVVEQYFTNPFGDEDERFNQFFGPFQFRVPQYRQKGTERREVAGGTGFVVSKDGLILTNRHVVDIEDADFTVIFSDGVREEAKILAKDAVEDLAVLKIEKRDLPAIPLGDSDALRIGQSVIAIGNTLGEFQNTVSVGVVSGLARKLVAGGGGASEVIEGAIQTDAAINPGNSGGPLLNLRGEAIGVNTAIVVGSQNVGFAVPINKAKKAIADIEKTGKISYAYLGVRHVLVTEEIQEARDLSVDYGALVLGSADGREPGVAPNSPAAKAGLREGDVILSVNGQRIDEQHSLTSLVTQRRIGETVVLRVLSNGEEREVSVALTERPE